MIVILGKIDQNIQTITSSRGKILNYLKSNYHEKCILIFKKCLVEQIMKNIEKNPQFAIERGIGIPKKLDIELGLGVDEKDEAFDSLFLRTVTELSERIAEYINSKLVGTMPASNISINFDEVHNLMFDNDKYLNIAKIIAIEQTKILKEKEKSKNKEAVQHKTKPKIDFNDNQNKKKLILGKLTPSLSRGNDRTILQGGNDRATGKAIESVQPKFNPPQPKENPSFVYREYKGIPSVLTENTTKNANKFSQHEAGTSSQSPKKDKILEKNKAKEPIPFTKAIANMNSDYVSVKRNQANPDVKIIKKSSPKQTSSDDSLDYYTADSNFDGDEEFENIEKSEAEMKEKKNEEDWVHVAKKNNEEPSTSSYAVVMDEDSDDMEDDFFKV
ncbi:unnamed protein product [Meloidogyne enterolobii]|uniref:Uncharacterized protein n=1 Tax=Meloidogyne enterolobii TaxID=390850 RepID=A0ACB1AFL5_MELEN